VYYYDNNDLENDTNDYTQEFYQGASNYAGTFMFNVDKEGK
jgi:hypothetical protein